MSTAEDQIQHRLADYERLAISTGEWDGTETPVFSNESESIAAEFGSMRVGWSRAWAPTPEHPHPEFVCVTVHRKNIKIPTTVVIRWDEAIPAVGEWRDLWLARPVTFFGAYGIRAAFRHAFRDVIPDTLEQDERETPEVPVVARDWLADLAACATEEDVRELHRDAKAARAVTVELEREIRKRLAAVLPVSIAAAMRVPVEVVIAEGPVVKSPSPADLAAQLRQAGITVTPKSAPVKGARRQQKPKPRADQ